MESHCNANGVLVHLMLFVSIKVSLEKDSVIFSAFVNYNIMLCIELKKKKIQIQYSKFNTQHDIIIHKGRKYHRILFQRKIY